MFLFLKGDPWWISVSLFLTPLSFFMILKGAEAVVRVKSVTALWFVSGCAALSLLTTAFFTLFLGRAVPEAFFNFSLPFGALSLLAFEELALLRGTIFNNALVFNLGVVCNACAVGCLIHLGEKLREFNKKLDDENPG
ncbi:MAG TPA: hypothetical protein VIL74_11310 [Pyrinomonadaceae bacterium]|jgi:amino acid transporter